jgi:twinkle protein
VTALDLHAALDREGIRIPATTPGKTFDALCPRCNGGRARERNFRVTIDDDGKGAVWLCNRANNCGWTDSVRTGPRDPSAPRARKDRAPPVKPEPIPPEQQDRRLPLYAWWARRRISAETVDALGVFTTSMRLPRFDAEGRPVLDDQGKPVWQDQEAMVFPYVHHGEVVNHKYRWSPKKFRQDRHSRRTLFNADSLEADDLGIIVEGEADVLALWEAGYRQVVSLPDGAPPRVSDTYDPENDDDDRYEALRTEERFQRLKRIVIAVDTDDAGRAHAEEIARRMGKERCWLVEWPRKDGGDVLRELGPEAVRAAVEGARPYPMPGILDGRALGERVAAERQGQRDTGYACGIDDLDGLFRFSREEGTFAVVTGVPGYGKTVTTIAYSVLLAEQADARGEPWHTLICSPEMRAVDLVKNIVAAKARQPFYDGKSGPGIAPEDLPALMDWVNAHYTFLEPDDAADDPTLDWIIECVRLSHRRNRTRLAIIDPWNEIEIGYPPDRRMTNDEWIAKQLQRIRKLVVELACSVVVVAHPKKIEREKKGGKLRVPTGYDIAYSAGWNNKPQLGITVHRAEHDKTDELEFHVWKARQGHLSKRDKVVVRFSPVTKRLLPKMTPVAYGAVG